MMKKILILFLLLLTGCFSDQAYYDKVRRNALSYYKEKYGLKNTEITASFKAGNSSLFGYVGVKDRAYEIDKKYYVYWNDETKTFSDNRQAKEIQKAFEQEILYPLLQNSGFAYQLKNAEIGRTYLESFDECVFKEYYDGDILSFLKKEKPRIFDLRLILAENASLDHESFIDDLYEKLNPLLSGFLDLWLVDSSIDLSLTDLRESWLRIADPGIVENARLDFGNRIRRYYQKYIEIAKGIFVCCSREGFLPEEGDITLVEEGPSSLLQQLLDDSNFAMPLDAEENKKGGYMVDDQRHETRVILDDPDLPCYRLEFSERALEELQDERIDAYIVMDEDNTLPLQCRYGYGSQGYLLFEVCSPDDQIHYTTLHTGNLYYLGTVHRVGYKDD